MRSLWSNIRIVFPTIGEMNNMEKFLDTIRKIFCVCIMLFTAVTSILTIYLIVQFFADFVL
jgi:hypothetical protein